MAGFMLPDARMQMPELMEGRKPTGPVEIDWKHPVAREIAVCIVQSGKDLVTGRSPDSLVGGVTLQENAIKHPDNNDVQRAEYLGITTKDNKKTFFLLFRSYRVFDPYGLTQLLIFGSFSLSSTGNANELVVSDTASNKVTLTGLPNLFDTHLHSICVTEDGPRSATKKTSVYVDGIHRITYDSVWNSSFINPSNLIIGGNSSTWTSSRAFIEMFIYSNREMSPPEICSLHKKPYQFLIPAGT